MSELAATRAPAHDHGANPWLVLVLVCMAQFMVILDATIVNVALPSIQEDLNMSDADLQWVVNAYALTFGGFLLLGGRAGDLIGRKRVFLVGVVVFTVASLLNGLAPSSEALILFRGLQGLGAALIAPAALSIITTTFEEGAERTKAMGVWAAIAVGGGAVGLVLGGVLTTAFSWPWIFYVNVPVGIAVFIASMRIVPESKDAHAHKSYDVAGAVTVTAGLLALVYGIVKAQEKGWTSLHTGGFFALAVALLIAFVVIERRSAEPLVRLSIFRVRTVRAANVVMFLVAAGLFAMFYFNTLYLQRVLGYSALEAGLAFLPFTAGIIIGAGSLTEPRPEARRARGSAHRDADGGRRPAPLHAAAAGRLVRHRPPPGDHARVDRNGAHVRPDHAHRDERHPRGRRGPGLRPLQHLAADRRRARSRDPRDALGRRHTGDAERARSARRGRRTRHRRSWTASTSRTSGARHSSPAASLRCSSS